MAQRSAAALRVKKSLSHVDDDLEPTRSGCCFPFIGRAAYSKELAKNRANSKLAAATQTLEARVGDLSTRAASARQTAVTLKAAGKQQEALAALRRAKILERQLAQSQSALESLESQVMLLEDAKMQAEITAALQESTGKTKKTTKGLLKKAEDAVDGAAEVKDLAEDVRSAMEGLKTNDIDEDELMEELEAMSTPETQTESVSAPAVVTFTLPSVLPSVPKGRAVSRSPEGVALASAS